MKKLITMFVLFCVACGGEAPGVSGGLGGASEEPATGGASSVATDTETGGTSSVATGGATSAATGGATGSGGAMTWGPYANMPVLTEADYLAGDGTCALRLESLPALTDPNVPGYCDLWLDSQEGVPCCLHKKLYELAKEGFGPVDYFHDYLQQCLTVAGHSSPYCQVYASAF